MSARRKLIPAKAGRYIVVALGTALVTTLFTQALAHKEKHTDEQLRVFQEVFMEQVRIGDLLFHGDAAMQKKLNVTLTKTGMACAMCHPFGSDNHPHEFPKFQEHREAERGCPDRGELPRHEGARGVHLLVEPRLEARSGKALTLGGARWSRTWTHGP